MYKIELEKLELQDIKDFNGILKAIEELKANQVSDGQ